MKENIVKQPKMTFEHLVPYPDLFYVGMPMLDPRARAGARLVVVLKIDRPTSTLSLCPAEVVRSWNPNTSQWGPYDETCTAHQEVYIEIRSLAECVEHDPNDTGFGVAYCRMCDAKLKRVKWEWKVVG